MTSQSPADDDALAPRDYVDAWVSIRLMVTQGGSWSGRERNHLFLNLGGRRFADVSSLSNADCIGDGRSIAVLDWDDDGRLDFFLHNRTAPRLQFFRNAYAGAGGFLVLELRGTSCNRDAIGARVRVEIGERVLARTVCAGDGYLSQSSKRLHFGLGEDEVIRRVTVRWPDGTMEELSGLEPNRRYRITQGEAEAAPLPPRTVPELAEVASRKPWVAKTARTRVPLIEKIPMAEVGVPSFENADRKVADLTGGPVLLNLWQRECAACREEFGDLREAKDELDRLGLRIVTLTTDPLDQKGRALDVLEDYGLEGGAGYIGSEFMQVLEILMGEVLADYDVVPLPTSLLLDDAGQLVAIYPGKIRVADLTRDLGLLERMDSSDLTDTRLFGGWRLARQPRDFRALAREFDKIGRRDLGTFYRTTAKNRK